VCLRAITKCLLFIYVVVMQREIQIFNFKLILNIKIFILSILSVIQRFEISFLKIKKDCDTRARYSIRYLNL